MRTLKALVVGVAMAVSITAVKVRREMEAAFGRRNV